MHSNGRTSMERRAKGLGQARSKYTVNSDFGYFNSQVPDSTAFQHFLGAPAGEETQEELQGQKRMTTAPNNESSLPLHADIKPAAVKTEKENIPLGVHTVHPTDQVRFKRARLDEVKTEERAFDLPLAGDSDSKTCWRRISQLEEEVSVLRRELRASQDSVNRVIEVLQRDREELRRASIGLGARMNRVEGHVNEMVDNFPAHGGWRSEVGSRFDPDWTLAEVEDGSQPIDDHTVEDGSQPVEEPWWAVDGLDVDVKQEEDV
ncbi:hypothetical protein C8R47DRAFT_1112592 [Mycena vitilis]|nr:hypothetical protein C8R47DRAFT_1112592 [Mycena vitilis]